MTELWGCVGEGQTEKTRGHNEPEEQRSGVSPPQQFKKPVLIRSLLTGFSSLQSSSSHTAEKRRRLNPPESCSLLRAGKIFTLFSPLPLSFSLTTPPVGDVSEEKPLTVNVRQCHRSSNTDSPRQILSNEALLPPLIM